MRIGVGVPKQFSGDGGIRVGCLQIRMGTAESKIQSLIRHAARAYTAGPYSQDARAVCERLALDGIRSTVCYWNIEGDQPLHVMEFYVDLLGVISSLKTNCYLSVKAPALAYKLELLQNILERAKRTQADVHFDSLAPESVDLTFSLIDRLLRICPKLGCTLPARWQRSLMDADLALEMDLRVRVVKGEWPENGGRDVDPRKGFLNIIDRLAAGRARHVAVATHNAEIAREALNHLKATRTPCELELLYGLPVRPMLKVARDLAVPVRMYVPYGRAGLPYRLREAARNPRIVGWFLHDLLRGSRNANF
jgi:proline dehydrogenase